MKMFRVIDSDRAATVLGLSALVLESASEYGIMPKETKALAVLCGAAFAFVTNKIQKPTLKDFERLG